MAKKKTVRIEFKEPDICHEIMEANPKARGMFEYGEYGIIEIDVATLTGKLVKAGGR